MIIEPVPRRRRTPVAESWATLDQTDGRPNSTRITDFLVFTAIVLQFNVPGLNQPLKEAAMGLGVLLAYTRRPLPGPKLPAWFWGWLMTWFGWLLMSTYVRQALATELFQGTVYKRLLHIALYVFFAMAIATGRFDLRSAASGLVTGILVGVSSGFLLWGSSAYPGRLTGFMGDPNSAGFVLLVLGLLAIPRMARWETKFLFGTVVAVGIYATFSRTSLLAAGVAVLWLLLSKRVKAPFNYVLLGLITWSITQIPDDAKTLGPFATRTGSDILRARIDEAATAVADRYPVTGNGLGSIFVPMGGDVWFFHNTYDLMRSEGGWVALTLFLILSGVLFYKLTKLPLVQRNGWVEGAMVAGFICGLNLGDVFCNTVFAVVLGMGARHWVNCQSHIPAAGVEAEQVEFR